MQRRILFSLITAFLLISFLNWSCSKLDTTDIGSSLLPNVDNVKTFDTTLLINTTQGIFNDTSIVSRFSDHALGVISNDPLFGRTNADIFMQLKPSFYPFFLGNSLDTLVQFDSVILCLKYIGFWGDSTIPVHLEVREVADNSFRDDIYTDRNINYAPSTGAFLASTNVDVRTMPNYIKFNNGRDSVNNQIRIKMPTAWAAQLYGRDSSVSNTANNAFLNDSVFRRFYNGIAVIANGSGNGLIYTNIADTSTKLEIHFKKRKDNKVDSIYSSLVLSTEGVLSSSLRPPRSQNANHIVRNRSGAPVLTPSSTELYLQASSGTYVNLNIPGLGNLPNMVIHRAEIIIEQLPSNTFYDNAFSVPNFLYLDQKDTGTLKWKPIYYDLNPTQVYDPDYKSGSPYFPNPIDFQYYGGFRKDKTDLFGAAIKYYNFNITRHVQQIVTKRTTNNDFRLFAPYNILYPQYSNTYITYNNNIAYGRVKVGSGTHPSSKLRLRIVYSKL